MVEINTYEATNGFILHLKQHVPAWIQGAIIDVETTGMNPDQHHMTAFGYARENYIAVHALLRGNPESFRKWAIKKTRSFARPLCAYYKPFEEKWLETPFDIEIQPIPMRKKRSAIKLLHAPHDLTGADVTNAPIPLVAYHLFLDLIEELALYITLSHEFRLRRFNVERLARQITEALPDLSESSQ